MDLSAYLLAQAIAATTPPGETEADARSRADAIAGMLRAYAPGDMLETMLACQCIMMQFVAAAAMRDASNPRQEAATLAKARAGAITASRVLHQWVTKFENERKRNELRAAQVAKANAAKADVAKTPAVAQPTMPASPEAPEPPQVAPAAVPTPVRNGQIADGDSLTDDLLAAAATMRLTSPALKVSGSGSQHALQASPPADRSHAA
jgi:hypothetical protein